MHALATRLSLPTAAAVMAAGVIVASPPPPTLTALPAPVIHSVQMPDIQIAATGADILQFPASRQWAVNRVGDFVTISAGLVKAGQGVQQTIAATPGLIVTVTQQVLARDFVGALGTVEAGLVGAVTAIGRPILVSMIDRNQRQLAVQQALQGAVPAALIGPGAGLLGGFDDVATSAITAGQNVVALRPINLGNLVTAVVDGVKLVAQGLSSDAGEVVDGIVFAQQSIGKALATQPAVAVAAVAPVATTTAAPTSGLGLGAAIGLERQWRSHNAGLRTTALVSLGSALFVIMGGYTFAGEHADPTRVAAQVASGIGFLRAGVIMQQGATISGLNTAATL